MCEKKMERKLEKQPWLWTMSSGSSHCHFETPRSKVYVLDEEIPPSPLEHREVMRQTRSETDNVSEHTIDDVWTDAKDDVLFEDLVSAARLYMPMDMRSTREYPKVHDSGFEVARCVRDIVGKKAQDKQACTV